MFFNDRVPTGKYKDANAPRFRGSVKLTLKNVHNGKTEVIEKHNATTNALPDIFAGNYGGVLNYNNFADLYRTYLGGVLVFGSPLDASDPNAYGIPANSDNPLRAHAGQTPLTSQSDDTTRGDPDDTGTVLTSNSVKLVWQFAPSAGNGIISSLGLTHSDVGSFGCGINSQAQRQLTPFANVASVTGQYAYGNNSAAVMAVYNNMAYTFYLTSDTSVNIYKTPVNVTRFKLQGGALNPLTDYTERVTATIQDYDLPSQGACYYYFDFANDKLVLFGVASAGGNTLLKDEINLTSGAVTSETITVTGAQLWKFCVKGGLGQDYRYLSVPVPAIIKGGYLFVYGYSNDVRIANKMYKINLASYADVAEVDTSNYSDFTGISGNAGYSNVGGKRTTLGGLVIQDSFIINGATAYGVNQSPVAFTNALNYVNPSAISAPVYGMNTTANSISVCKLYLATKFNLDSAVEKTPAQSMTVEYTLTEA